MKELEDLQPQLQGLSPEEEENLLFEASGYAIKPVDIDTFLDTHQYLGHIGPSIYPFWRKYLRILFPSPYFSPYREVAITGSIGGGKSTFCEIAMIYEIYLFLCRSKPSECFGFTEGEPIYIALMNHTKESSEETQIEKIFNMVSASPWFNEQREKCAFQKAEMGKKMSKKGIALNLPHNITLLSGSLSKHMIGRAVISGMLSELNVQTREGGKQSINSYVELKHRLKSRFGRDEGLYPPGHLYLDSSKKDVQGILEQYFKALKDDTEVLLIEGAFWDFHAGTEKDNYSGETFKVYKGSKKRDPFVLHDVPEMYGVPDSLCMDIPIEFYKEFTTDCVNSLRDWAGVATESTGSFITSIEAITSAMCLLNPIIDNKPIIYLDMVDPTDTLMKYIDVSKLLQNVDYFVHLDLGLKHDRAGIAFTRVVGRTNIERFDRSEGTNKFTQDSVYQTDLVICIKNKPDQEVPLYKIQDFLTTLAKEKGVRFGTVSFDGFASADLKQRLTKEGFFVEIVSVDRKSRQPYDTLRQIMLEGRIKIAYNPVLEKEFKELVDKDEEGIDHPEETALNKSEETKPSKDIADAVAGSLWTCSNKAHDLKPTLALEQFVLHNLEQQREKAITMGERINKLRESHKKMGGYW